MLCITTHFAIINFLYHFTLLYIINFNYLIVKSINTCAKCFITCTQSYIILLGNLYFAGNNLGEVIIACSNKLHHFIGRDILSEACKALKVLLYALCFCRDAEASQQDNFWHGCLGALVLFLVICLLICPNGKLLEFFLQIVSIQNLKLLSLNSVHK